MNVLMILVGSALVSSFVVMFLFVWSMCRAGKEADEIIEKFNNKE